MAEIIDKQIIEIVNKYIAEVKKHYTISYVFLFGSFAKGTTHKDSDIDIAIVVSGINDTYQERLNMMRLRWDVDLRIEPHPISIDDFKTDATGLVYEIKQHGVQLYAA